MTLVRVLELACAFPVALFVSLAVAGLVVRSGREPDPPPRDED